MKKKIAINLLFISILLCLCACTNQTVTSEVTSKDQQTTTTTEETSAEILSEAEPIIPEKETVNINLKDVIITPQDNWKLLDYDEENQRVKYEIEVDGSSHEITLYTTTEVKLDGKILTTDNSYLYQYDLEDVLGWTTYSSAFLFSEVANCEFVFLNSLHENDTKQICALIGDDRTLVLECEPYVVLDEVAKNVSFKFERSNPNETLSFFSSESCKSFTYFTRTNDIEEEIVASNDTTSEPVSDAIVGPEENVKPSYPYLKSYIGGGILLSTRVPEIILTIHSTDDSGCPYEVTINGVDYTFERRDYRYSDTQRDHSQWSCYLTDYDSLGCTIDIYGDVDFIQLRGTLADADFYPLE